MSLNTSKTKWFLSLLLIMLLPMAAAQAQRRSYRQGSGRQRRDQSQRSGQQRRDESEGAGQQSKNQPQGSGQPGQDVSEGAGQRSRDDSQGFRPQRSDASEGFSRQYQLILDRNIFSRDRRPYVPRERRSTFRPPPPPIETDFCLKGIARENGQLIAFFEQLSTGVIGKYALDAKIARGSIKTISLDMVEYTMDAAAAPDKPSASDRGRDPNEPKDGGAPGDPNGPHDTGTSGSPKALGAPDGVKVTQVHIGQTLQGLAPGSRASLNNPVLESAPAGTSATPGETPADTAPQGDDASEILKRLMQRRQQELGN